MTANPFQSNVAYPFSSPPAFVSPIQQSSVSAEKLVASNVVQESKLDKDSAISTPRSPLDQYYVQLASSAALINQIQQSWNFRTFNPYILQRNLSPTFPKLSDKIVKSSEAASPENNALHELTPANENLIRSQRAAFGSEEEKTLQPTETSSLLNNPCVVSNEASFTGAGVTTPCEVNISSNPCSIPLKPFASWYSRPPLSFYFSSPNPFVAPNHSLPQQSLFHPFPIFHSNLASAFKM